MIGVSPAAGDGIAKVQIHGIERLELSRKLIRRRRGISQRFELVALDERIAVNEGQASDFLLGDRDG